MTVEAVKKAAAEGRVVERVADGWSAERFDKESAINRARKLLAPSFRAAPDYPLEALGELIGSASRALAAEGQLEPAMAGQCFLSAASLVVQGIRNVETLAGVKPLSLYMLTLGDSGDGKSTAEATTLWPVHERQRAESRGYRLATAQVERDSSRPMPPHRIVGDPTVEGIRRDLDKGLCSQGIFSSEAASMLTGYGMSAEHRTKTAAVLNRLWDDGHLSVSRGGSERTERYGCRLAAHLLIQPSVVSSVIADPALTAVGFWPRFLVAWPSSGAPRIARRFQPDLSQPIGDFWRRTRELLDLPLPDDATSCPSLVAEPDALTSIEKAFEIFEREAKRGSLSMIKPFALRATEQVFRVAAVICEFEGRQTITKADAKHALALVNYSLDTWLTLVDTGELDRTSADALRLYEWLLDRPDRRAERSQIIRLGPACVRSRDTRDAAIGLLAEMGLCSRIAGFVLATVEES